jgi:hypothetical protein
MYKLYHIKGIKWGCSNQLEKRLAAQNFTINDVCEIIEIDDIDNASDMERELNIRDGYGWNKSKDYRRVKTMVDKAKGKGASTQIKNKIGIFGYTKKERLKLNTKANIIRAKISAEKRKTPIDVFDYKSGKFIKSFNSQLEACETFNLNRGLVCAVLNNTRNHTAGYSFKYKLN